MSSFVCPVDGATLVPIERQSIEIDHCPTCRGVWLDRGELDKIIERSLASSSESALPLKQKQFGGSSDGDRHSGYDDRHRPKRKRSFLEDLFD